MSNDGDGGTWSKGVKCSDPPPMDGAPSLLFIGNENNGGMKQQLAFHATKGRSPGVLFCHGFQSSMQGTKALALETTCRRLGVAFCRFDYRGHGSSAGEFSDCTLSDWIQDASTVLETVMTDHDKVVVIGSSMGGWIACHLALCYPEKVVGLLGIAAAPDFLEDIFQNLPPLQQDEWKTTGFLSLPTEHSPVPYRVPWQLVEDARNKWNLLGEPNDTCIAIQCRVRLVHGKVDTDIPWTKSLDLMERLATKDVTLTIIKDGDHRLSRPHDIQRICVLMEELLQNAS